MAIGEIVSVSIQAGTVNPARKGFGIPLIMSYHTRWAGLEVRSYSTFSAVATDFQASDMAYKMAQALFSQNPRPEKIKIGRLPTPGSAQNTILDFADMATGTNIAGSVISPDGTVTPISITWTTNLATTLALLETAIEAISGILSATVASSQVTVVASNPGQMFHFSFSTDGVNVRDTTASWGYETALEAHADVDGNFYCVLCDNNSPKNMDKVARWVASTKRIAMFAPQYTKPSQFVSGEFSAGADFTAFLANSRVVTLFTQASRANADECYWASKMLPKDPGSAAWFYKNITGLGADPWTDTERTTIETTNKGNHYTAELEVGITRPGKVNSGEWIDVVIGLDALEANIQERIFALQLNSDKVSYTDTGFAMLTGELRGALAEFVSKGVLDEGWTVQIIPVLSQNPTDRTARTVRGLEFSARLAGAVYFVSVSGVVTA